MLLLFFPSCSGYKYLLVGLLVRSVGHQAQSLAIALRPPATKRCSDLARTGGLTFRAWRDTEAFAPTRYSKASVWIFFPRVPPPRASACLKAPSRPPVRCPCPISAAKTRCPHPLAPTRTTRPESEPTRPKPATHTWTPRRTLAATRSCQPLACASFFHSATRRQGREG